MAALQTTSNPPTYDEMRTAGRYLTERLHVGTMAATLEYARASVDVGLRRAAATYDAYWASRPQDYPRPMGVVRAERERAESARASQGPPTGTASPAPSTAPAAVPTWGPLPELVLAPDAGGAE